MSSCAATAAAMPSAKTGQSQRLPRTASSGIGMKSGTVMINVPMRPITKPSAPITNVCRRNSPAPAIAAIRQKRSAGLIHRDGQEHEREREPDGERDQEHDSREQCLARVLHREASHDPDRQVRLGYRAAPCTAPTPRRSATTTRTVAMARPGNGASSRRRKSSSENVGARRGSGSGSETAARACAPSRARATRVCTPSRASRG